MLLKRIAFLGIFIAKRWVTIMHLQAILINILIYVLKNSISIYPFQIIQVQCIIQYNPSIQLRKVIKGVRVKVKNIHSRIIK